MPIDIKEWLRQSEYDFDTARTMFKDGRYGYAVFMCHLSVEKALKAVWQKKHGSLPPKTHNLVLLLRETGLTPSGESGELISELNGWSVLTRYPEELAEIQKGFSRERTNEMMERIVKVLEWIKTYC